MKRLFVTIAMLVPSLAIAQVEPPGPSNLDPNQLGDTLVNAIQSRQWGLVVAAGILIMVWVLRRFVWKALDDKKTWLPWIATAIGALAGLGTALLDAPEAWLQAVLAGVAAGLMAAGQWSLLGIVRKKDG